MLYKNFCDFFLFSWRFLNVASLTSLNVTTVGSLAYKKIRVAIVVTVAAAKHISCSLQWAVIVRFEYSNIWVFASTFTTVRTEKLFLNFHSYHDEQFLPYDTMLSAKYAVVVCQCVCVCVCVYVCLSVTLWYSIKMAKHRITQIMPHNSPGL